MANSNDTFTDTNGVLAENHTLDSGGTWGKHPSYGSAQAEIQSNQMTEAFGNLGVYYSPTAPAGVEYDVQESVGSSGDSGGPAGRIATGADTYYEVEYFDGSTEWQIASVIAGSFTTLATYVGDDPSTTRVCDFQIRDATKKLFIDSVERISTTNNSITAAGRPGFITYDTNENLDDWSSVDVVVGGIVNSRTLSDNASAADSEQVYAEKLRAMIENVNVLDLLSRDINRAPLLRALSSSLNVSDAALAVKERFIQLTSEINIQDNVQVEKLLARLLFNTLDVNDSLVWTVQVVHDRLLTSNIETTDALLRQALRTRALADNLDLFDFVVQTLTGVRERILSDNVDVADSLVAVLELARMLQVSLVLVDTLGADKLLYRAGVDAMVVSDQINSLVATLLERVLASGVTVSDTTIVYRSLERAVSSSLYAIDTLLQDTQITRILQDNVDLVDVIIWEITGGLFERILGDNVVIVDSLSREFFGQLLVGHVLLRLEESAIRVDLVRQNIEIGISKE